MSSVGCSLLVSLSLNNVPNNRTTHMVLKGNTPFYKIRFPIGFIGNGTVTVNRTRDVAIVCDIQCPDCKPMGNGANGVRHDKQSYNAMTLILKLPRSLKKYPVPYFINQISNNLLPWFRLNKYFPIFSAKTNRFDNSTFIAYISRDSKPLYSIQILGIKAILLNEELSGFTKRFSTLIRALNKVFFIK